VREADVKAPANKQTSDKLDEVYMNRYIEEKKKHEAPEESDGDMSDIA